MTSMKYSATLAAYIQARIAEFDQIPESRVAELRVLGDWVKNQQASQTPTSLNFICTHNSRRSHLAQIWAGVAARHFEIDNVDTFSGGTEATAFHPNAVEAIRRCGFDVSTEENPGTSSGENPIYVVRTSPDSSPWRCFSKVYDQSPNPSADFAAIMVCESANAACPVVTGASLKIPLPYVDPKISDGTDDESATYDERCRQIAREMLFAFDKSNEF